MTGKTVDLLTLTRPSLVTENQTGRSSQRYRTMIRTLTWISTHIIFVAQVDAADLHLKVFDHLSRQFLHKPVLLLLLWFLWKQKQL